MLREATYTVLLIEQDIFLRRLIVLGLQSRNIQVVEASSLAELAEQTIIDPNLLILDIDNGLSDDATLLTSALAHPYLSQLPMVILAWEQESLASRYASASFPLRECLAKPFDARTLHATTENLLVTSSAVSAVASQSIASPSTISFVSYTGLCPLATAAGLLLTVTGFMLQFMLAGLGIVVTLIAICWWALGKNPERRVLLSESNQAAPPPFHSNCAV